MVKISGHFYLTDRQVRLVAKGRKVSIRREGRTIVLGLKSKAEEKLKIRNQIKRLREKLRRL